MKQVGIVGATGYTGLELCRLLQHHPQVQITHLYAGRSAGQSVADVFPNLHFLKDQSYHAFDPKAIPETLDILFFALPHGEAHRMMADVRAHTSAKIIDLSADFRLTDADLYQSTYGEVHGSPDLMSAVVQGFPELYADAIRSADFVACPGCYPTSVILGLKPLRDAGLAETAIADCKSGVSGAGKALKATSMFSEVDGAVAAYGTGVHRHNVEMNQHLDAQIFFSPHLMPMKRGILSTLYVSNTQHLSQSDVEALYTSAYQDCPFIALRYDLAMPSTKYVSGSNMCMISVKVLPESGQIVVFSAIDNLIKGASGQAIQVMNVMHGWDETTGLTASAWGI